MTQVARGQDAQCLDVTVHGGLTELLRVLEALIPLSLSPTRIGIDQILGGHQVGLQFANDSDSLLDRLAGRLDTFPCVSRVEVRAHWPVIARPRLAGPGSPSPD